MINFAYMVKEWVRFTYKMLTESWFFYAYGWTCRIAKRKSIPGRKMNIQVGAVYTKWYIFSKPYLPHFYFSLSLQKPQAFSDLHGTCLFTLFLSPREQRVNSVQSHRFHLFSSRRYDPLSYFFLTTSQLPRYFRKQWSRDLKPVEREVIGFRIKRFIINHNKERKLSRSYSLWWVYDSMT